MNGIQGFGRLCRTAFRSKGLTFINIFGLGTGLAVALFLLVYLQFEFSYDRHFRDADRIYRMLSVWKEGGEARNYPINLGALSPALVKEVPEVETASRLYIWGSMDLKYENGEKAPVKSYMVDSTFFECFLFHSAIRKFGRGAKQSEYLCHYAEYCRPFFRSRKQSRWEKFAV